MVEFKCPGRYTAHVPAQILADAGIAFPEAYTEKNGMAGFAGLTRKYLKDEFAKVPFCVSVEAEAFGAPVKIGDAVHRPRPIGGRFSSIEELAGIQPPDITKGRMGQVLDAVGVLAESGEKVILNITGPFTIIYFLVNSSTFFQGLKKNPAQIKEILTVIEKTVIEYGVEGIKKGASIISYEDSVGVPDVVGPESYKELSAPSNLRVINGIKAAGGRFLIHLCGRTSAAMENAGMVSSNMIETGKNLTYSQALANLLGTLTGPAVIGHKCMEWSFMAMEQPVIWRIETAQI